MRYGDNGGAVTGTATGEGGMVKDNSGLNVAVMDEQMGFLSFLTLARFLTLDSVEREQEAEDILSG